MDELVARVRDRWARRYTPPKETVPVYNHDGKAVYVTPETLKKEPGKFRKIPDSELNDDGHLGNPRHPGQQHLPRKPKKPHKPEIERKPPPAPIHPPIPRRRPLPPKRPKPVPLVKPPKVPEPSPAREYKKVKRFLANVQRVADRFLEAGSPTDSETARRE